MFLTLSLAKRQLCCHAMLVFLSLKIRLGCTPLIGKSRFGIVSTNRKLLLFARVFRVTKSGMLTSYSSCVFVVNRWVVSSCGQELCSCDQTVFGSFECQKRYTSNNTIWHVLIGLLTNQDLNMTARHNNSTHWYIFLCSYYTLITLSLVFHVTTILWCW